jgi:hypothetical protein
LRVLERHVVPCDEGLPALQSVLAALQAALRLPGLEKGRAEVVLSSHFVHYAMIPWNDEVENSADLRAFVEHCFHLSFGEAAKHWELRVSRGEPGTDWLGSGVAEELTAGIREIFAQSNLHLLSLQPHLMQAINHVRKSVGGGSAWVAAGEADRLVVALIKDGTLSSVRGIAGNFISGTSLQALIRRESILLGITEESLPLVFVNMTDELVWKVAFATIRHREAT